MTSGLSLIKKEAERIEGWWAARSVRLLEAPEFSQERRVDKMILHEDYNCDYENDIAVVKLDRPVEFIENRIATISLPCDKNLHNSKRRKQQRGQGKKRWKRRWTVSLADFRSRAED